MNCIVLLIIVLNIDHYKELIFELWIGLNNMSWVAFLATQSVMSFLWYLDFFRLVGMGLFFKEEE